MAVGTRSRLWAFSGIDGAGKTTQIDLFVRYLEAERRCYRRVWLRVGYTPLFDWAKAVLRWVAGRALTPQGNSDQRTRYFRSPLLRRFWLTLAVLDVVLYLAFWVRFLGWTGCDVVADRWIEDSELDLQLNFPEERPHRWLLWRLARRLTPSPTAHFVFLIPVEESMRRSKEKKEPFPDEEAALRHRSLRYEDWAESGRISVLNGLRSREELHVRVCAIAGEVS